MISVKKSKINIVNKSFYSKTVSSPGISCRVSSVLFIYLLTWSDNYYEPVDKFFSILTSFVAILHVARKAVKDKQYQIPFSFRDFAVYTLYNFSKILLKDIISHMWN